MKTDILMFFPRIKKTSTSYRSEGPPPIGLGYLSAVCKAAGYSVQVIDLNHEVSSSKHIKGLIERCQPRFVGVSFVTEARHNAFRIFQLAKAVNAEIITVAGGPHPSLTPMDTLSHISDIDYVVIGEGERTFVSLLSSLNKGHDVGDIPGLARRCKTEIRINENRDFVNDLDSLPFPDFPNLDQKKHQFYMRYNGHPPLKTIPVLSSRGCPFRCNFCATSKVWGSRWRYRSPASVLREIDHSFHKYNIDAVWFVDDNFNSHPDRMLRISQEIKRNYPHLKWICNVRIDNLTEAQVKAMAEAGCLSVEFGAESGSQRILDEVVNKKIKVEKILEVDEWCHKYGIIADAQFIISHPTETQGEANQTIDLIRKLKGRSTLQILKIYPGTEVEKTAREKNIMRRDFSWALDKNHGSPISSIIGDAPLYLENLTLQQVMKLMAYAWTDVRGIGTTTIIRKILAKLSSPKDLYTYFALGLPILIKKILGKGRG